MKMRFLKLRSGRALYVESDKIWMAKGMCFFAVDFSGRQVSKKYKVGGLKSRLIASNRLSRQLLREGIHHLIPLQNQTFLVCTKRMVYIVDNNGNIVNRFYGFLGNKPGHQGICVTPNGTIFFGEYSLNPERLYDTKLYRSCDNGLTFEPCLTLDKTTVRHIHFVKYDLFEKAVYMGTGDEDFECKLYKSVDDGDTWEIVGEGSQNWRAIGVCVQKDFLLWGTDAGSVPDQNYAIKMNKSDNSIKILTELEGPCHGCATFKNGAVFLSTGVEGGENEKDKFARLRILKEDSINEIFKLKKDCLPLILQYGVMRFPLGTESSDRVVFTAMGLKKGGEIIYVEKK